MDLIQSVANFHKSVYRKIGYSAIQKLPGTQYLPSGSEVNCFGREGESKDGTHAFNDFWN